MPEVLAPEDLKDAAGGLTTDTLTRGTRLGRYELLVPIAMGGMAKVWAARQHGHRGFQKLVAIKTILPNLSEDPAFESMFLDEARIASNVHHPNVCDIYELGEEDNVLYLAMEWVNGDSLVRLLRASGGVSERLDPRIAARIVADACAGLHSAHELSDDMGRPLGVVHRDMSPHNILLSADGNVKLTDFGVAKAIGQLHDQTSTGTLKGKVNYMAPEQVTGTHIDRRSDIFALGCVLYEVTTGHLPFRARGEMDHQVLQRIIRGQCTPPGQVLPGYPRELEGIILRAIANQPIQRFASAERMRMALEEWLQMSGPIVTQSHVAATVRARVGSAIDARRERIRVAMATTGAPEDTGATPNPSASGVHPAGPGQGTGAGQPGSRPARKPAMTMSPLNQPIFVPPPPAAGAGASGPQAPGGLGATLALPRPAGSGPGPNAAAGPVDLSQTTVGTAPSPFASRGLPGPSAASPQSPQVPGSPSSPYGQAGVPSPYASAVSPGSSSPTNPSGTYQPPSNPSSSYQRVGGPGPAVVPQATVAMTLPMGQPSPGIAAAAAMGGASGPTGGGGVMGVMPGQMPVPAGAPGPTRHYLLASGLGIVGAFALGVGVFLAWHWMRTGEPTSAVTAPSPAAVSVIVVPPPPPAITGAIPPTRPASSASAVEQGAAAAPSGDSPPANEPAAAATGAGALPPPPPAAGAAPAAEGATEPAAPSTGAKAQSEPAPPSTAGRPTGAPAPASVATVAPAIAVNTSVGGTTVGGTNSAAGAAVGTNPSASGAAAPPPADHHHHHHAEPAIPANPY